MLYRAVEDPQQGQKLLSSASVQMNAALPAELAALRQVLGRAYLPVASLRAFVKCCLVFATAR
ncbi:MAG: hypothetical protein J5865_06195, partial [Lachnospiraceae bacterium]|nr:hypothetical protein [Lachnospiraceae bacterium]